MHTIVKTFKGEVYAGNLLSQDPLTLMVVFRVTKDGWDSMLGISTVSFTASTKIIEEGVGNGEIREEWFQN